MNSVPIVKDVCFVGGGHSHALVLRRWAMRPIPGVRLTLVSSASQTPYSGMLPGLIAGHYSFDDIHIDLTKLCQWAGVRIVENTITGIDLEQRQVHFDDRPALGFDVLSLDTGSTPDLSVPGSSQHVTPVKPVSDFHARWEQLLERLEKADKDTSRKGVSIGVVGSGAGGFELVAAMRHRLRTTSARCYWFLRGDDSLGGRPQKVGELAKQAALDAGIDVVRRFDVVKVESGKLIAADGREALLDEIIWCTAATGPHWPTTAGLDVDARGFVSTNAYLQSTSHDYVFATGDIGTQVDTPSAKAGVFAVRQAPVLFENLKNYLLGESLKPYVPQSDFLSLMATGAKHAIANRGPVVVQGNWVWRWKDHIDQTFMNQFVQLPRLNMNESLNKLPNAFSKNALPTKCRGCGAKVGDTVLQRVLNDLMPDVANSHLPALSPAGDTAVVDLPTQRLVQSVDQINALVDDPYLLGRIAALHAISDVVTLDATLHSAQVLLTLPESTEAIVERDIRQLMQGILAVFKEESCALIGGHTTQGPEMAVGVCVNATMAVEAESLTELHSVKSGDALILTKPLGIGILFAGQMQGLSYGADMNLAVNSMLQSNRAAASILRLHRSKAMTDVTGFGLIGHLNKLLGKAEFDVQLDVAKVPVLDGAQALAEAGVRSSLWQQNQAAVQNVEFNQALPDASVSDLLFDPQTSGGLLAIVPEESVNKCLEELAAAGYVNAACVGHLQSKSETSAYAGPMIRVAHH